MIIASRDLPHSVYDHWDEEYQTTLGRSDAQRQERLEALHSIVERDLKLLGVTAIEDKL